MSGKLNRRGHTFYWNGRPIDLHICWKGADTYIERAVYDDAEGGELSPDETDELNEIAATGACAVFAEGRHG